MHFEAQRLQPEKQVASSFFCHMHLKGISLSLLLLGKVRHFSGEGCFDAAAGLTEKAFLIFNLLDNPSSTWGDSRGGSRIFQRGGLKAMVICINYII